MSRPIPQSTQAERMLLAQCITGGPEVTSLVSDLVSAGDFYRDAHARIFEVLLGMLASGRAIELTSTVERIADLQLFDAVGGASYIVEIASECVSTENYAHYAEIVRHHKVRRDALEASAKIEAAARDTSIDVRDMLDMAGSAVLGLDPEGAQAGGWQRLSPIVSDETARLMERCDHGGEVTGISTGLKELDRMLAGLHRTDYIVLAARPSMGKTALAMNIARNVAGQGVGVGVFSLEMSAGQLVTRMVSCEARVEAGRVRRGRLDADDWQRWHSAAEAIHDLPLMVDDTPGLTPTQLQSRVRRLKALNPNLGLIVLDYIGLMEGESGDSRQEQVSKASRAVKLIAKKMDVAVLVLSQLNRKCEDRNPKIPQLSDLRESGAIEQDADVIMFIYRDEYYNPDTTDRPGVAEVIVAKQRNGPTGSVDLSFQGRFTRFDDLERRDDVPPFPHMPGAF